MTDEKPQKAKPVNAAQRMVSSARAMLLAGSREFQESFDGAGRKVRFGKLRQGLDRVNWALGSLAAVNELVADRTPQESDQRLIEIIMKAANMESLLKAVLIKEFGGSYDLMEANAFDLEDMDLYQTANKDGSVTLSVEEQGTEEEPTKDDNHAEECKTTPTKTQPKE